MIKSPYNFVPLSEHVFFPEWAEQISHDVPFSDGESGEIKIQITAKSPIFVRNGSSNENETSFSNSKNSLFIPGTSIKGMIRSVFEIITFSKLNKNFIDLWTPTYRDLSSNTTGREYLRIMRNVKCGWLQHSSDKNTLYEIVDCGDPIRISKEEMSNYFGNKKSIEHIYYNNALNDDEKTAKYKYDNFKGDINIEFNTTKTKNKTIAEIKKKGKYKGTIVFTGQPGPRNDAEQTGKRWEFVFKENGNKIKVTEKVLNNFLKAYYDGDNKNESKDWTFWKKKLEKKKRIPVFFIKKNNEIMHFGLSMLYKLPYDNGIEFFWNKKYGHYNNSKKDMTELLFGFTEKQKSLKGRVQFSHGFAIGQPRKKKEVIKTLGSPHPSYYPNYLKNDNSYPGYNNKNSELSGWKRYPIHASFVSTENERETNTTTSFVPVDTESVFQSVIKFHNLKPVEIGALLSALTFHGNSGEYYHSIGMAKSIGFGKIKLDINYSKTKEYIEAFENYINSELSIEWRNDNSIIELFSMSKEQNNTGDSKLEYMNLNIENNNRDEFIIAKNNKEFLKYYSDLKNIVSQSVPKGSYKEFTPYKLPSNKELFANKFNTRSQLKKFIKSFRSTDKDNAILIIDNFNNGNITRDIEEFIESHLKKQTGNIYQKFIEMQDVCAKIFNLNKK